MRRARILVASLAIILVGCGSANVSPPVPPADAPPQGSEGAGSPVPAGSGAIATPGAVTPPGSVSDGPGLAGWAPATFAPDGTPPDWVDPPVITPADLAPRVAPLPAATLKDPTVIGDALYDPGRMAAGVVSLLSLMGVAVVPQGSTGSGDLWLTEDEVRGLIAMGSEDARAIVPGMPGGSPYTFADLHAALKPLLPAMSVEDLAAKYAQAYQANPGDLVPQVFLTAPIAPDTGLTRVHLWLLFVDGFVPGKTAAARASGRMVAQGSALSWGTAGSALQGLVVSPDPRLSTLGYTLLLAHLPMIAWTIPFAVDPSSTTAHEGHGGLGQTVAVAAHAGTPGPGEADPVTGVPLLLPTGRGLDGIPIHWSSGAEAVLSEHGSLDRPLGAPATSDAGGMARISYQPREEAAHNRGEVASAVADLDATVGVADLVTHHFVVPPQALGFLFGSRTASGMLDVEWHKPEGLWIYITNVHAVFFDTVILPAGGSRVGADTVAGFLPLEEDGTFRGTIPGYAFASSLHMEAFGSVCEGSSGSGQWLYVVGRRVSSGGPTGSNLRIVSGAADGGDVHLTFYPASAPTDVQLSPCLNAVYFPGGGPDGRPNGWYSPFNDSRWTEPGIGYTIHTAADGQLGYKDWTDLQVSTGHSVWYVTTTHVKAPP